jgi:hypothetical protein
MGIKAIKKQGAAFARGLWRIVKRVAAEDGCE